MPKGSWRSLDGSSVHSLLLCPGWWEQERVGAVAYRKCTLSAEAVHACHLHCLAECSCGRKSLVPVRFLLPEELCQCDPGLYTWNNSSLEQPWCFLQLSTEFRYFCTRHKQVGIGPWRGSVFWEYTSQLYIHGGKEAVVFPAAFKQPLLREKGSHWKWDTLI